MPFGLCNAPATFQRLMDNVLMGLKGEEALVYLDDIIIFGSSLEEHTKRLERVLQRLEKANLYMQLPKCTFAVREVDYSGHIVSNEGIKPDPKKISAIKTPSYEECKGRESIFRFGWILSKMHPKFRGSN